MTRSSLSRRVDNAMSAARFLRRATLTRHTPLLAQVVVTRRCNLACGYCNEYDDFSPPVATDQLLRQVDALAALNTAAVTLTGGEPLLHPQLAEVVRAIRRRKMIATMITNGFRLNQERIEALNDAGLQEMQISIDNLEPDEVSMKSLNSVDKKLALLAEHARFKVNINSVLGVSEERTEDALAVADTAAGYGFYHSVGVLHDHNGLLKPLNDRQLAVYRRVTRVSKSLTHRLNYRLYQRNLIFGRSNDWQCRAGARYLYICEEGRVHWCSQRRGYPNIPVTEYTPADLNREYKTRKECSPTCTLACVHQMSMFDRWRGPQLLPDPGARP